MDVCKYPITVEFLKKPICANGVIYTPSCLTSYSMLYAPKGPMTVKLLTKPVYIRAITYAPYSENHGWQDFMSFIYMTTKANGNIEWKTIWYYN